MAIYMKKSFVATAATSSTNLFFIFRHVELAKSQSAHPANIKTNGVWQASHIHALFHPIYRFLFNTH